ncbi:MAG: shikimate dehydrogenase [Kangiellaceae bacterium]|jgi:shikimate dehydrogenase|nr:shikimate dehydrogenase [Kangiellaceae bacterium]
MIKQCAVIGKPIEHSLSPTIHQSFAEQTGIALSYVKKTCEPDDFVTTVLGFFADGGFGMNVTLPFKQQAHGMATHLTDRAKLAGSVNTLYQDQYGSLCGDTTDGEGLINDLSNKDLELAHKNILIMGAGGAAHAIIPELLQAKAHLFLLNRTRNKAEQLVSDFAALGHIELAKQQNYHLIINTLSEDGDVWLSNLGINDLTNSVVYDISYGARAEKFLKHCDQLNAQQCYDGLGMLVEQAALSFNIWHDQNPATQPVLEQLREIT